MVENIGRKITLIVVLLAVALGCMLVPEQPFRLGLDLQGGTRLVYRFDFENAHKEGKITDEEFANPAQLLRDYTRIIRDRVDPQGVLEPIIRAEGTNRVTIELPGNAELSSRVVVGTLGEAILRDARALSLQADEDTLRAFPATGGMVQIGPEKIKYDLRRGSLLEGLERGRQATDKAEHQAGTDVKLISDDAIRNAIENTGELHIYIGATQTDFTNNGGGDPQTELTLVQNWIRDNPNVPISRFNNLARDQGGPPPNILWFPHRTTTGETPLPIESRLAPLVQQPEEWRFTGDDIDQVRMDQDELGYPAVYFRMKPTERVAFTDFTGGNVGNSIAIVLSEEIGSLATIQQKLPGEGIISGGARGFSRAEVDELVTVLRSGSLKIKPLLEHEERVGATLGDEYVRRGFISALFGLALVLVFIVTYYRRLGLFAALSLLANLTLLLGSLAFLQATLTLPGIAGIILTVGMAVDANILIFERIREEANRGCKVLQAAKNGFEKALSTIVDANLTTLITGIILYQVGTGPVRGFATTLSIGILSSMFSALVITRVLVHVQVSKGIKEFRMRRIINETKIAFMSKAKAALTGSIILILAGVALFFSLDDRDKLSIDFLGGFTVTIRTENPETPETIRGLVSEIPGTVGEAEVKPILDSRDGDGFTRYRITGKTQGDGEVNAAEDQELTGENEIRTKLAGLLEKGPIDIDAGEVSETRVAGKLYFEDLHPETDIAAALVDAGVLDADVKPTEGGRSGVYDFDGICNTQRRADVWVSQLSQLFGNRIDSAGSRFQLAEPVPEASIVGAQVVGELRNKAVIAMVLSLFAAVMYIRARFAEYSYGFAAVAALVHDVMITLGVLSVAIWTDVIEAEISLPMIAAFLTIIGYSLNDTIVVFDRVRENLPRMKGSMEEILDTSINQTLSRTLLTSVTTLLAVLVLLFFNLGSRNVLEGFAFALSIGVLVGTYSSIFVASPVLLWLETRAANKGDKGSSGAPAAKTAKAAGAA